MCEVRGVGSDRSEEVERPVPLVLTMAVQLSQAQLAEVPRRFWPVGVWTPDFPAWAPA